MHGAFTRTPFQHKRSELQRGMARRESTEDSFLALKAPDGVDQHMLYLSSHRLVATYAMSLADLDAELQRLLVACRATVKQDHRRHFCGRIEVVTGENKLVNVMMDACSNSDFVQLKYWLEN